MIYASNQTPSETVFLAKCTFPRWPWLLHYGMLDISGGFNNDLQCLKQSYTSVKLISWNSKCKWNEGDHICLLMNYAIISTHEHLSIWPTVPYSTLASSNLIQPDHTCYPSYPSINWWMYLWSHLFFYVYIQTYTKINKYENISYISYISDMQIHKYKSLYTYYVDIA